MSNIILSKTIAALSALVKLLGSALIIGVVSFKIFDWLVPFHQQSTHKKFSQLVVDRNGIPLRAFADQNGVWRYPTQIEKVSPLYIEALLNYEDRRFYEHAGVNPISMLRAVTQWLYNGKPISGGSTITMQVARIIEPHSRSVRGKLWQMLRATQLEWHLSKDEILTIYLNNAPFGGPIEGIEAATFTYLGKRALHLTRAEAALMAVLPQSPSRLRPDRYPDRAEKARNKVLKRLQKFGVWNKHQVSEAFDEDIVASFNTRPMNAPLLARHLVNQQPTKNLIKSTIDSQLQVAMADEIRNYLYRFSSQTSASAMLMDNQTMEVLAYVGTADFGNPERFGHVDMNQAIRSPGSTLKPFIFGMALDKQLIHSQSLLQDVPLNFNDYSPENFTRSFSGAVSAADALQRSLNIPAVQLLNEITPASFNARMNSAGVKLYLPQNKKPSLSIALGGAGVKLEELVAAYRALIVEGLSGKPRYTFDTPITERFLLSPESAWITAQTLSEVPLFPRQKNPYLKKEKRWLAHKTGTSYGYRDSWMIASNVKYTLGVWIGKPDGTPSPGEFGRRTAAPLVSRIFNAMPQEKQFEANQPIKPESVKTIEICWPLGLAKNITEQRHCAKAYRAFTINEVTPKTLSVGAIPEENPLRIFVNENNERVMPNCYPDAYSEISIAVWPVRVEHWLPSEFKRSHLLPSLSPTCANSVQFNQPLEIVGIPKNSILSQPPSESKPLEMSVSVMTAQGNLQWILNGEVIAVSTSNQPIVITGMAQGENRLMVYSENGQYGEVSFTVR